MKKILDTILNHERYQMIACVAILVLAFLYIGCEPKCRSILNPEKKITIAEYNAELTVIKERAQSAELDLEQQRELLDFIYEHGLLIAQGSAINPISLLTGFGAILGIGATVDNVRKRKVIKKLTNDK